MTLKAAYFEVIGFSIAKPITPVDLKGAKATATKNLNVKWQGNLHALLGWAELLVTTRASQPGLAYPQPAFASEVIGHGKQLEHLWSEVLRYHKNVAYDYEVGRARNATEWFLANSPIL
jgi:hypothetical protein